MICCAKATSLCIYILLKVFIRLQDTTLSQLLLSLIVKTKYLTPIMKGGNIYFLQLLEVQSTLYWQGSAAQGQLFRVTANSKSK